MIYNLANQLITDNLKEYKKQLARERRAVLTKMLDYYQGDNVDQYLKDRFKAEVFQEIPPVTFNVTKRFIERLSRIYTLGANRTLSSKQNEYESLTKIKAFKFKHLERMTRLLGTLATEICWDTTYPDSPKFTYNPIYYFDVHLDPNDPFTPIAIEYPMLNMVQDPTFVEPTQYCYYDAEKKIIMDENGKVIEEYENPYGVLPFVFTHRDHPIDEFFTAPAMDICVANEAVNILMTELALGCRFACFPTMVCTGIYQDENVQRGGSDEIIILPEGANMTSLSPDVNVNEGLKLVRSILELVASNNHLTISFEENHSDRPQSGVALKIRDLERHEDYQDDLELWELYEQKFYEIERVIAGFNGVNLPNTMGVNFNEPEFPQATQDEILMNTFMLENNLTTHAKLLQKYNKDLTLEQAQAIIDENKEANGAGKEQQQRLFNRLGQGVAATKQG